MAKILIVDDEQYVCDFFSTVFIDQGHEVRSALTLSSGREIALGESFDAVFLDVRLPDGNGLNLLSEIRGREEAPEVIIVTGFGDPKGAALAINNDAWDYIEKSTSPDKLMLTLNRALQFRNSKKAAKQSRVLKLQGLVGSSSGMETCFESIANAAGTNANVLITGETGTGKELVANAIHKNSNRSDNRFVIVDCASLPENLTESVLFGHTRGAFTGADQARTGLIKLADGGTLFLDEVGELPLSMQKKFLRVLETRRFRPIGARLEEGSDFRLVAATHRDLDALVRNKLFREDLLYRLRSLEIEVPAFREHMEDVKELAIFHMNKICDKHGIAYKTFDLEVFTALTLHDWPGNIRELVNVIEAAFASARHEPMVFPWHLPKNIRLKLTQSRIESEPREKPFEQHCPLPSALPVWREYRRLSELQYIKNLMALTDWNIAKASRLSGIARSQLYLMLEKHQIKRNPEDSAAN